MIDWRRAIRKIQAVKDGLYRFLFKRRGALVMNETNPNNTSLPNQLVWLADAPLFIDEDQVARFYDAVVRPESTQGVTTLEVTREKADKIGAKLGVEASVALTSLASLLTSVFAFIKPEIKGSAGGEYQHDRSTKDSSTVELHPIVTPQRQLVQLTLHYLINNPDRLFFVDNPSAAEWRDSQNISMVPRELVFLDLPGEEEKQRADQPAMKIIPMAAEFENGKLVPLYNQLTKENGELPPKYPEGPDETGLPLRERRKTYWHWFDSSYRVMHSLGVVEKASSENGRIRWIDYRLPINNEGDTLHLHLAPAGKYDTGVFAYNFIKRGYKHGLRLVGTLKSEPDMNVLAIYEK
jgi:hypothetical protein